MYFQFNEQTQGWNYLFGKNSYKQRQMANRASELKIKVLHQKKHCP